MAFRRPLFDLVARRLMEPRRFIQVLAGPRQSGKTTLIRQVLSAVNAPSRYETADSPALKGRSWLEQQWQAARAALAAGAGSMVLVLDEVQKLPDWSEDVKRLWDEDTTQGLPLKVVLLGSAPLLVQRALTESLAGRFELLRVPHWSYAEMQQAFGFALEQYVFFGAYPGAAVLVEDESRWRSYVQDALIETSISRDVLLMTRVDKPALLRRLFDLSCRYSGQVLSYQKMLGQLQDAGNTVTLAHYLELLEGAGLVMGLQKYAGEQVRQRASSPKLLALDTALVSALSGRSFAQAQADREHWGHLVETCVGASLVNAVPGTGIAVGYWAGANRELDFVLSRQDDVVAIEVKSGRDRVALPGLDAFSKQFKVRRKLLVGEHGIPLGEFLTTPVEHWLEGP
jgi:hypothetical protein